MISLKRNSKGNLMPASGKRVRTSSIYQPGQATDFEISRTAFSDFLKCPRDFYLNKVLGLKEPSMPSWPLNSTVDALYKKEFDVCREKQVPHRLMWKNQLPHVVPFKHEKMDEWRDALRGGIKNRYKGTNIILKGGIDDAWLNTQDSSIIIVDYKSQAKAKLETSEYFEDVFHQDYAIQLDFYNYLFREAGFKMNDTAYILVANANKDKSAFDGCLTFEEAFIPYKWDADWIPDKVDQMLDVLNSSSIPDENPYCELCAYNRELKNLL